MNKEFSFARRVAQMLTAACCLTCAVAAEDRTTHVNALASQKLIADKKVVVLDIRTPEEFAAGHIAGATNINFKSPGFTQAISSLDTNKTYLLHCASGNRSSQALQTFRKLEFPALYHLDGGLKAWEKAGLPVEK